MLHIYKATESILKAYSALHLRRIKTHYISFNMKICFLLAIVACATALVLPTKSDVQNLIAQAQKALQDAAIPESMKVELSNLLSSPNVEELVASNWDTLATSLRSEAEPAERCLLLFALLLNQLIQTLTTTAAPVVTSG